MKEKNLVGLAGDWHGNSHWAVSVLETFANAGIKTVYQLGDFGLWPGYRGTVYLKHVISVCEELGITLWITLGNHEDYTQVEDIQGEKQILASGDGWEVAILPRGFYWEHGGRTFCSLGGAPSIDFEHRTEGVSWWPEEAIKPSDLDRLTETAEVMLTHDAPDGGTAAVQRIIDTPASVSGWSAAGLAYAATGRDLMNRAIEAVRPKLFAHGHMHVADERYDEEDDCRYVALGPDGVQDNIVVLDLDTLNIFWPK